MHEKRWADAVHMTEFLHKNMDSRKPAMPGSQHEKLAFTRDVDLGSWRHHLKFLN